MTVHIVNDLSNRQTTQVIVNFEQILQTIENSSANTEEKQKAEQYVKEIQEEIKKKIHHGTK